MRHRQDIHSHHYRRSPVVYCSCRMSMRALHALIFAMFVFRFLYGVTTVWKSADDVEFRVTTMPPTHGKFSVQATTKQRSQRNDSKDNSNSTTKPLAIIHVGPPKTATTTIQCGLDRLSGKLARKDNYYYLGNACRVGKAVRMNNGVESIQLFQLIWELQQIDNNPQQSSLLNQTKALLQEHRRQHHNVILSSEHFTSRVLRWHDDDVENDDNFFNRLKFLLDGYHVRIVVGYRHYFEWLPSIYYQHYHHDERYLQWHDEQGEIIQHPSFRQFAKQHVEAWEQGDHYDNGETTTTTHSTNLLYVVHPTIQALRLWSRHFDDIVLLNLHDENEADMESAASDSTTTEASLPLTKFVCDVLPSAHETCRVLQEKGTFFFLPSRMRISGNFHAERLVEEVYQQGLIIGGGGNVGEEQGQQNHTKRVIKALPVHLTKYMLLRLGIYEDERYWICDDDDGVNLPERLRVMSLFWMEQVMRDEKWGSNHQRSMGHWDESALLHDKLLEHELSKRALDGGKFCDIDVGSIFGNTELSQQLFGEFWIGKDSGPTGEATVG